MITNNLLLSRVQRYLCRPGAGVENLKMWETPKHTNQRNTQNNFTFIPRKCVRARKYVLQVSRGWAANMLGGARLLILDTSSCYNALNTIKCMQGGGLRGCFTYWIIFTLSCIMDNTTVCTYLSSRSRFPPVCIPREGCCCLVSPTACSANSRKVSKISPPVLGNIFYSLIVAFSTLPEHCPCHEWEAFSSSHWSTRGVFPGHWSFVTLTRRMSSALLSWLSGHSRWRMIVTGSPVSAGVLLLLHSWLPDSRGSWSHGRAESWGPCWCSSWRGSWCSSASAESDDQKLRDP